MNAYLTIAVGRSVADATPVLVSKDSHVVRGALRGALQASEQRLCEIPIPVAKVSRRPRRPSRSR